MNNKYIIIIPDIHGRTFWKSVINKYKDNDKYHIVFLGDYLDPYSFEKITPEMAIENFKEIMAYAEAYPKNITLLIGNHDLHYFPEYQGISRCSRQIIQYKKDIMDLFDKNRKLFSVAYDADVNDKKYLFTHAGLTNGYINILKSYIGDFDLSANILNNMFNGSAQMKELVCYVSYSRGGYYPYGSFTWADVSEHLAEISDEPIFPNVYQIFGHTLAYPEIDKYFVCNKFAMLDCRTPFILECDSGKIEQLI